MSETSTVVPGGDLAGRSAEYRRGYVSGMAFGLGGSLWLAAGAFVVCAGSLVAMTMSAARAGRAEAQLAEMRAQLESCGEDVRWRVREVR